MNVNDVVECLKELKRKKTEMDKQGVCSLMKLVTRVPVMRSEVDKC